MDRFFIHHIIWDIKELAVITFKAIVLISCMLGPFYLVHLIETYF